MENEMFESACAKQTRPNYSVGNDQDEAEAQLDRLTEWCACKKCEEMPTANRLRMFVLS